MSKTVVGLFMHPEDAQKALQDLSGRGIGAGSMHVMGSDQHGGVYQMLQQQGVPADDAQVYAESVRRGGAIVMGETNDDQAETAVAVLDRYNSMDTDRLKERYTQSGFTQYDMASAPYAETEITRERDLNRDLTIPIVEEQLEVGKRTVERGGARIHTFVSERPVDAAVTLREETVTVDRRPVDRVATDADFQTRDITMTETGEEAVVAKTARVVEEVVVGKTATERTETVRDTVRRTEVDVEEVDGVDTTSPKR